jgi:hypothetical protein
MRKWRKDLLVARVSNWWQSSSSYASSSYAKQLLSSGNLLYRGQRLLQCKLSKQRKEFLHLRLTLNVFLDKQLRFEDQCRAN